MIPSSPRRTWVFLVSTLALYFAPDLVAPAAWRDSDLFLALSAAYQGVLVLLGFAFGPAICRAMVIAEINDGPVRRAIDQALSTLAAGSLRLPPVVCADHMLPFAITAGLMPARCEIYVSSGLVARLSPTGLRFLLARAAAHAGARQRLAALLPVLVVTVLVPDPKDLATWLALAASLAVWLVFHWLFELDADRRAARLMEGGLGRNGRMVAEAINGLREVHAATTTRVSWLTPHPPMNWRLRAVAAGKKP